MSNANEKSMQEQSFPSKEADRERDRDRSMSIQIDHIEDILKITDSFEMDNVIAKNSSNTSRLFDQLLAKLYSKIEVTKDQIDQLIYSLKFVDTLNLFMPHYTLSKLSEYMNKIFNMMLTSNNSPEIKDLVIKQIKYTEMTVITLKKKEFKTLFFTDGKGLAEEIEFNLEQVSQNGKFDQKLFKQLQNLFYVVQGRIEEGKRYELQQKLNEMKALSIKYKKQKIYLNYDDYNDYSDYKNYSNVSGNLHDYNENFYDNDDYSYFNYNNSYNQERYGYRRYSYRNNNAGYYKHFENEEREIEHVVELDDLNNKEAHEDRHAELKEIEEIHQQVSMDDKANMVTPVNDNKKNEGVNSNVYNNNSNSNSNNDIEIIKTVIPSKTHYDYNSNSHYYRNNNYSNQQGNQLSSQGNNTEYTPVKKKIILKKNQKQRGQTLVEVPIPNTIEDNNNNKLNEVPTTTNKQIEIEAKIEENMQKEPLALPLPLPLLLSSTQSKQESQQSQVNDYNDTEIITTVINPTQESNNNNNSNSNNFSQKQQYNNSNSNNPKYNQYGYKQNQYNKNQGYYYNYNSNYHNANNYNNPNHYHHNNYYSNNQIQNSQGGGFKQQSNQNDVFNNYNNNYYKKNSQNKKYYQTKSTLDFVELDDLKSSDKQEQGAQSSPEVKREEISDFQKLKDEKETVKMDLEKMFEKEKQKESKDKNISDTANPNIIELKETEIKENEDNNGLSDPIHDIQEEQSITDKSDDDCDNEELERDESSDSIGDEELEREYNKFISESMGQIPKNNDDNYYINREEDDDDSKKNNKIIFEDEIAKDNKGNESNIEHSTPTLLIPSIEPQKIPSSLNEPVLDIPLNEQEIPLPVLGSELSRPSKEENEATDNQIKEVEGKAEEQEQEEAPMISRSENREEEKSLNQKEEESNSSQPLEQLKTNKYTDSIKTIDPKVLKTIKSKLSEDFEKNQQQQQQQSQLQIPSYVNYQASFPNGNSQMFHPGLLTIMAYYQKQMPNNKISLQNYIFNHYTQFLYHGRDSNIHKEYILLKTQEIENSLSIWQNINNFENKIIIPIYQRINFNVNKKRKIYYITFMKYKKLIQHILAKDKVLEKVKPYGSYMNNFLIDSGDIDICIVPKCNILEFASYLDKIKEQIVIKSIGEHKLSHHTGRYLLLKVLDNQTKFIIDITVHTMLPILNTNLVRLYSLYDQRFHILGLYIKHWAKINKIHGAADNFLSSYALLLMLVHFLQKVVEPRVLPNLQRIEQKEIPYQYYINGETITTNIYYEEDLNKIKAYMKKINNGLESNETATNLLVKFFEYYSYYFESEQRLSIHKEPNELTKKTSETIAFSIEDPFDIHHDPGKSMAVNSVQCNKFITSMKKEINYILNGEYVKRIDKICSNSNAGKN